MANENIILNGKIKEFNFENIGTYCSHGFQPYVFLLKNVWF